MPGGTQGAFPKCNGKVQIAFRFVSAHKSDMFGTFIRAWPHLAPMYVVGGIMKVGYAETEEYDKGQDNKRGQWTTCMLRLYRRKCVTGIAKRFYFLSSFFLLRRLNIFMRIINECFATALFMSVFIYRLLRLSRTSKFFFNIMLCRCASVYAW